MRWYIACLRGKEELVGFKPVRASIFTTSFGVTVTYYSLENEAAVNVV